MNLLRVFLLVVLALVSATAIHAKDWRGITPLHSTCADVNRLLGPAWRSTGSHSTYLFNRESAEIVFADHSDFDGELCSGKVPSGTVLSIFVMPEGDVAPRDLGIDLNRSNRFKLFFGDLDYWAYYDERSGFLVHILNGKIHDLCYLANSEDRHRCSKYYRNAKHFGEMRYDNY